MKLRRLRRRPAPPTAEPTSVIPPAPLLQVLICSNTGLPEQNFSAQTEKLRSVASYDNGTRSWYTWIPLDRLERAAEMLTALFEAARTHGTTIQVHAQPAGEGAPSEQTAGPS